MRGFSIPGAWIDEAHLVEVKPPAPEIAWAMRPMLPPPSLTEAIEREIYRMAHDLAAQERHEIDMVVEVMRTDQRRRGVAVIQSEITFDTEDRPGSNDYTYAAQQTFLARLDERVPYMNIFRFPSEGAYDAWVERGCPTKGPTE
jgi:hypothetical protein